MKKSIIAGASVLAFAGAVMPMAGVFAAGTDTRTVTDTLNVTVNDTCTMTNTYPAGADATNQWGTKTTDTSDTFYADANTWTATLDNNATKTSPVHTIAVICNKTSGWTLKAQNAAALSTNDSRATQDTIAYNTNAAAGTEGYYVNVANAVDGTISTDNVTSGKMNDLNTAAATIFSKNASTATASVDVSYTVGTSTTTEAGTYTGDVVYTLAPNA